MNNILFVIVSSLMATAVIFCGLKLFDIGSSFSEIIRKYAAPIGVIFGVVAVANFLISDILDISKDGWVFFAMLASAIVFAILGYLQDKLKTRLLKTKKTKTKRRSRRPVFPVAIIDGIFGIIAGIISGICFVMNLGTGIIVLCTLVLFRIMEKYYSIRRYEEAHFERSENLVVLIPSLCLSPIAAATAYLVSFSLFAHMGIPLSIAAGYLIYLCLYYLAIVVKSLQKR